MVRSNSCLNFVSVENGDMIARHLLSGLLTTLSLVVAGCGDKPVDSAPGTTAAVEETARTEAATRTFAQVKGEVIELIPDEMKARIKHEEIPDYMPAMIMPLTVRDLSQLDGLTNGDAITFRLNVTEDSHWIDQIEKVAVVTSAPELSEPNNPFPTDPGWRRVRDVEPLDIGDVMPNYAFTNELGQAVSLNDLKGNPYAFTFIYTRCPIPDFCPRMSSEFMETQRLLEQMEDAPKGWRLLSITIDPEYDTVEVLKGYASRYRYNPEKWSFLMSALIDITAIAEQFGLMFYRPDETINHNLRTVVIDREGKVHSILIGNTWKAQDLVKSIVDAGKVDDE